METPQRKYGPFDIGGHEKIPEIGHLTSFGSASLEIKRPNNDENNSKLPNDRRAKYLIGEAGKLNMTNAFYNESRRVQSNLEWKMRCQMLKEANSLGSSEAKEIYFVMLAIFQFLYQVKESQPVIIVGKCTNAWIRMPNSHLPPSKFIS